MMKAAVLLALVAVAAANLSDKEAWGGFKAKFNRAYSSNQESYRFGVFQNNMRVAEELQRANPEAVFGVTRFSDLTSAEFLAMYANFNASTVKEVEMEVYAEETDPSNAAIDWRGKAVTPVKDQAQCGSCWAFSAVGTIEGRYATKSGKLVEGSAQQLNDCDTGSSGCNGGDPRSAVKLGCSTGLAAWKDYAYTATKGSCKASSRTKVIPAGSCTSSAVASTETAMASALQTAPLSIALDATPLQHYKSGVVSGSTCNQKSVNHAVILVGSTGSAWIVKNSWGTVWGDAGYVTITQGINCLGINYRTTLAK